ncbi:MAG: phosphotransferase family protein [Myxococcota bacterium]
MSLPSDDELRPLFAAWLAKRWPDVGDLRVHAFENPKSGFSARTIFVPIEYTRGGAPHAERVVLRLENPEPAIYPQQAPGLDVEIDIQYRVMEALAQTDCAPLAGLIGYEADASVLGTPFFAMEYIGGDVTIENPPYTQQGFFFDASPDARRRMITEGLRILARVHTLDPTEAGLGWLAHPAHPPGIERQLDLWEAFGRSELRDRTLPVFDEGVAWLRERLPRGLENRFSWGDARLGNIIFRDARPVCITDFENSAIAPAEFDLGWWLMFDRTMHESVGTARLEGEPTRGEQRDLYCGFAGRDLGDTHFYEVLGGLRYTAIVVRVMNRAVERGVVPADHEIWKHNPAAMALRGLLDEA